MRKHFRSWISMTLALSSGLALGVVINWSSWAQQFSPLAAYTAESVERAVKADGTELRRNVRTIARRSDGSIAIQEHRYYNSHGAQKDHTVRYIKDAKTRKFISVYPLVGAQISAELSDDTVKALGAKPDANCLGGVGWTLDTAAPTQTLVGHPVILRARELRPTDSQGVHTGPVQKEWVAPELDCLVMRRESKSFDDEGALRGTTITEVGSVTVGEPSDDLFAVPPGLREMSPSEIVAAQNRVLGVADCSECARTWLENADRRYYAKRPSPE